MIITTYSMVPKKDGAEGSRIGRYALSIAVSEYMAGAREIGGNNRGPYVNNYLQGLAPDGSSWCAAFMSFCLFAAMKHLRVDPPIKYNVSAKSLLNALGSKGYKLVHGEAPEAGDLIFFWREKPSSWKGHVGIVAAVSDKKIWTIEGNRTSRVDCFEYGVEGDPEMEKLIGYVRLPDSLLPKKVDKPKVT